MIYRLTSESKNGFDLEALLDLINRLTNENKIQLIEKKYNNDELTISFTFTEWKKAAPQKYIDAKKFKSKVPVTNFDLEEVQRQVKKQIMEAAESELISSELMVKLDATADRLIFRGEYEQLPDERQAEQIGIYFFSYLQSVFGNLSEDQLFFTGQSRI